MALVRNTLLLPGGDPTPQRVNTQVRIQLINGGFAVTGAPAEPEILGQFNIPVDSQGFWQIDLIPNEQIDPDGTYYRVEETAGRVSSVHHFIVPRFVDVLSASRTSNVVTAVLETAEHGIRVGDSITVDLADNTYDGTFTVSLVVGATLTWNQVAANDAAGGTGTVNKTVWDLYDLIIDQPPGVVTTVAAPGTIIDAVASSVALSRWRQRLARGRAGSTGGTIVFIGDSITEGVGISSGGYRQTRFVERLRRRFQGSTPGIATFHPASSNIFNGVGDGSWPGGDDPWTYTGAVAGDLNRGISWHAASIPTTGTAQLSFFGAFGLLQHSQTVDGPTAAAVTLDGASIAALDGRNDPELNGTAYLFTCDGYGHHTFVLDPNDGPLVIEGFTAFEPEGFFFVPINGPQVIDAGHSGFQASIWGSSGIFPFVPLNPSQWTSMLGDATMSLLVVLLGVNDQGSVTPGQFEDNLVGIVQRLDIKMGNSDVSILFVALPGVPSSYANAMGSAAVRIGSSRAAALDLAALRPNRTFGADLSGDGTHPNDAGNLWVAEMLGQVLDPQPTTPQLTTPHRIQIDAANPPVFRLNWTEATTPISGSALLYDEAAASAVRERRHRVWLDPGTYQVNVTADHAAGRGQLQILAGHFVSNTPTLTSLGTVDTSVGTGITTTELGTTFVNSASGFFPIYVRKTNQANIARFVQLSINRISPASP